MTSKTALPVGSHPDTVARDPLTGVQIRIGVMGSAGGDAADAVVETQEGNNTAARLVQVGPDLTVPSLTSPATAAPGATITVNDTTRNQGGDVAGESTTALYLSANGTLDAADALLGSRLVPSLPPGATDAGSTAVVIPAGTRHNVLNTSQDADLKLYSLYSPPEHKVGTLHRTKKDADADTDHHFDGRTSLAQK